MKSNIHNLNIVFWGTPEFSNIILQKLINSPYKPTLVITAPDKPVGRKSILTPPPTKIMAKEHNITVLQPVILANSKPQTLNSKQISSFKFQLQKLKPDLFIVAAYGKIIPKNILNIPKYGAINIHPSILPRYRGPSPIQETILNGDKKTGVTLMLMDEQMDHGPILASRELEFPISNFQFPNNFQFSNLKPTYTELGTILFKLGADLLIEILPDYIEGKIKPKTQNHKKATYTKIIKREDGLIDWNKSAKYIERQLRAFTPWPGIYTFWNSKRLKILSLSFLTNTGRPNHVMVGKIIKDKKGFAIQTGDGLIVPKIVQIEGKKPQTAKEFLNGHTNIIGSSFIN